MANVVDHNKMRNDLMDGAIRTVAQMGLEGTTTRQIAACAHLNEAYIYRYFLDRSDLLEKSFLRSDKNFFEALKARYEIMSDTSVSYRERARRFFDSVWAYIFEDLDFCRFYVRYYYSSFFNTETEKSHREICRDFFSYAKPHFRPDTDADFIMHHLFITATGSAMYIAQNLAADTPELREKIFDVLFRTVSLYLDKDTIPNFNG